MPARGFDVGGFLANVFAGRMMMQAIGFMERAGAFPQIGEGFLQGLVAGIALGRAEVPEAEEPAPAAAERREAEMFYEIETEIGRPLEPWEREMFRERARLADRTIAEVWREIKEEEAFVTEEEAATWVEEKGLEYRATLEARIEEMFFWKEEQRAAFGPQQVEELIRRAEKYRGGVTPVEYAWEHLGWLMGLVGG
jgi:hypothetical protein